MSTGIDLSQEILAINMLKIFKSSLKHRPKHVLRPLQPYRDQALALLSSCKYEKTLKAIVMDYNIFHKPGLHMVVTIGEYVCDALKRNLKLSTHRLQVFLMKNRYL